MAYCPNCGSENDQTARFCLSCGQDLHATSSTEQPTYQRSVKAPPGYTTGYAGGSHLSKAPPPVGERIGAYFIDCFISDFLCCFGCFYTCFKDGINNGQSIGKGLLNLRVVDYNTGMPATYGQSCVRNFCECCSCYALIDSQGRRMGDYIAGTIVIDDR
ncbi:MAG: zinc-ribbon domain-containing protein [Candidatus Hodarchaeales archaeon]